MAQDTSLKGGAKVAQGGPKYLQGGTCPPTCRTYVIPFGSLGKLKLCFFF